MALATAIELSLAEQLCGFLLVGDRCFSSSVEGTQIKANAVVKEDGFEFVTTLDDTLETEFVFGFVDIAYDDRTSGKF